jgi:intraflagellar transport protein 172
LRVAKKHAPHLVNEINNKYVNAGGGKVMSGDDILNSAKLWEESRDYSRAIDTYLELKKDHFMNNHDILE